MEKYEWMSDEYGGFECEGCGADAPLGAFPKRAAVPGGKDDTMNLCQLCASTYVGNAIEYPSHYDETHRGLMRHVCMVGNLVIDATTGRKRPDPKEPHHA